VAGSSRNGAMPADCSAGNTAWPAASETGSARRSRRLTQIWREEFFIRVHLRDLQAKRFELRTSTPALSHNPSLRRQSLW
jgi:hypothetical protein